MSGGPKVDEPIPGATDAVVLEAGRHLDRYELLSPFARGGMASVWLGRLRGKHGFERLVGIKTILPEHSSDAVFRKMLIDEARIAARIRHPNVAEIVDVGEEGDVIFIVMEWVDGNSLQEIHRALEASNARIPMNIVLRIMADTCRGLHAAHELRDKNGELLGVVHRDVSPQNILVSGAGVAKLIDFGVAKARERLVGQTASGLIKGKIRYMPPEQALAREVDRRADVWAIGAVLQYVMTGRTPFQGSNDLAALHMILSGDAPAPLPSEIPSAVAKVVARALAPEPEGRFASAEELASALESAIHELNQPTSASDVSKFLDTALPSLRARRQKRVEAALAAAEQRGSAKPAQENAAFVAVPASALAPVATVTAAEPGTSASLASNVVSPRTKTTTRWKWIAALTAIALTGIFAAFRPWHRRAPESGATTSVAASPPATTTPLAIASSEEAASAKSAASLPSSSANGSAPSADSLDAGLASSLDASSSSRARGGSGPSTKAGSPSTRPSMPQSASASRATPVTPTPTSSNGRLNGI